MKAKMILKKGMVFLFAMVMVLTGIFSLGVMAASGLEGAYISPKSKMGLQYANNFSRDVSKSQVSVPNFMADSDTNGEEPNKSFNAQQVAAGNSDAGQKWRGFAAYAKNHDPSDFWVKYKNVTTANGKSVDLKIEVTDWKTQNDESKPLPSNGDMFGHDNNSAHLGYAIGFSYKKTGVVMFSGFKWVKFKYTFLYNGTNTKAPFTGFATFQDIDQNQYVTITDGTECISKASYIGGSDGNTWCEPDGWTYKSIKDQNASSGMGRDTFDKTCISLYVNNMTDMSIKYGWTGHTAIAYFDLAPWAMNSFEDNANPDVPKKLIQSGSSWISNEKTSAVAYKLGDTYSYRYEDTTPTYATDILAKLVKEQNKTAISSYVWEDTLDAGLTYIPNSMQIDVGGNDFTSKFADSSNGQNIKFSAKTTALSDTSFYGKKVTVTFKVKIKDSSYNWLGHERTADNKYRLIPNTAKRSMTYLKKLAYDDKKKVYTVTDGDYTSIPQNTSTVWSKVPIGDPDNPDPDPKKTVSDEDEKNVLNNTLTNADETFTYTVSKEIEKNMPSTAKYSKVVIKDAVDSCLTVDSVKFYAGDKDVTSSFAPTSANKGNYLEYAASSELLNNKDFYGNNAGTTVKMVIKTHIDAKKVSIETLREHGHLVENDKKTETNIKIKNETTVTTTKADNQGTWDVDKKVTPPPTTTDSPIPSIKDPVKKVSDSDDLNWDATVKQDGEKTPGSHNRVTDVTNQWLYTLTQEIPAHTVELYHYKSFTITDAVDSCLSYDVKDITIKAGDKDYTDKFDITKGDDNSLTLTAKSDVLASDEFYGGKSGNKIVVSFPVKISADAKTLKDENLGHLEIGGKKMAHLQKVSDLQKLSGFTDLVKSKDNEYYLSKKEKKEWKRLSYTAKQRYIRQAERQLKRQKKRNGIAKTEPSSVQEKEKQAAKIFSKERKYRSNTWKEPVDKKEIGSHGGNGEIASKSRDSRVAIRSQSTVAGGEKAADIASSSTSAETAKAAGNAATKTVDTAAASTGAGLAALVAKKTAENFKEMLQQKNTAIESQRIKTQTKLSQIIEENKTGAGSPGVAAAAMLASVVVTVMYFAVQIAVTIFFVLLILLIPIIVIVSFLGIIITLLSGFAAAVDNTDYASGSGASIVAVAVQEIGYHEGAGNHTKYGVYTGTDGMSWCHAFVSWCANECGFIESNIIPKTAACETGRQWFIHKQQYQKAGSYTPETGDIIYFDKGGVGESHHVGIVEYVENGIVHTIEGNKNNQVMRGHYELAYKGIMGYGTPDYPDEGLTSSTASEILSKAQEIGKMMVEEKWVYSNTDLKGSLAAAEQSAKRTNCAHGVCLVLQEVGLLKKGQIFFGNKSGELSCNGTVRKQIEKGFDIIKTGGKKSKDLDLKPGDICLFKGHTNIYAGKDENGKTYWYDFGRDQTKDKKPGSVFVKSVRKGEINWAVITVILRVKDQDSYGSGKTINIPSPYGDSFTYMGWSLITSTGSNQYKLRVKTGEHYDVNGFGKIGDRYVIACTPTFGKIGDEIDFVLANGRVIHGVMGDEKNMSDAGCNKWGHDGGHSVVEFVVNKSMWYHTGKTVTRFHPEWAKSRVVKAVNLGKNHLK